MRVGRVSVRVLELDVIPCFPFMFINVMCLHSIPSIGLGIRLMLYLGL